MSQPSSEDDALLHPAAVSAALSDRTQMSDKGTLLATTCCLKQQEPRACSAHNQVQGYGCREWSFTPCFTQSAAPYDALSDHPECVNAPGSTQTVSPAANTMPPCSCCMRLLCNVCSCCLTCQRSTYTCSTVQQVHKTYPSGWQTRYPSVIGT